MNGINYKYLLIPKFISKILITILYMWIMLALSFGIGSSISLSWLSTEPAIEIVRAILIFIYLASSMFWILMGNGDQNVSAQIQYMLSLPTTRQQVFRTIYFYFSLYFGLIFTTAILIGLYLLIINAINPLDILKILVICLWFTSVSLIAFQLAASTNGILFRLVLFGLFMAITMGLLSNYSEAEAMSQKDLVAILAVSSFILVISFLMIRGQEKEFLSRDIQ